MHRIYLVAPLEEEAGSFTWRQAASDAVRVKCIRRHSGNNADELPGGDGTNLGVSSSSVHWQRVMAAGGDESKHPEDSVHAMTKSIGSAMGNATSLARHLDDDTTITHLDIDLTQCTVFSTTTADGCVALRFEHLQRSLVYTEGVH